MSPTLKRAGLGVATGLSEGWNAIKPKAPDYNPASTTDPSVQRAMADEAKRRRMGKGYQSTILTSMIKPVADNGTKETLGE